MAKRKSTPAPTHESKGPIWDNTTICFGNDCQNCEREKAAKAPTKRGHHA